MFVTLEKYWFWQVLVLILPATICWFFAENAQEIATGIALIVSAIFVKYLRWNRHERDEMDLAKVNRRRLEAKAWYFEGIVQGSANIIFTTDAEHRIMKFNEGSVRAFGKSQPEVLGKMVNTLFHDTEAIQQLLYDVGHKGHAELTETLTRHSDGEGVWLSLWATRMKNPEGEIIGEVFNGADITSRKKLEDELKRKNDQLLHLSITDGLTGLYNLRHLHEELTRLCQARKRFPDRSVSVALFDVDKFKSYNDTLGHPAGDQLLARLAAIFKLAIRQGMDTAYRMGGDEFLLLLPDTRAEGAKAICDRVLNAFRQSGFPPTSLSVGIATDKESPPPDAEIAVRKLLERADKAMYEAKQQGGDRLKLEG